MMGQFTRRQWLTLIVISIADFANAVCVSLQAPFYPQEAEKKGASPSEYGLVFGIFELVVFIISPIYGQRLHRIGPKLLFNGGILTTGTCAIFFGLLDKVDGHYPFIILSFVIRIVEALGNAAFLTASFAIIAKEFPDNVATTFASLETFFGLGLIVGPTVGGALYQIGGYVTPFAVLGSALFLAAVMTAFVLPIHENNEMDPHNTGGFMRVLKIPGVMLATASIIATSMSIGFLQATLEPHLRQFDLSPVVLGLMFVINGGTYAVTAPVWGWFCDKRIKPKIATVAGCILVMIGFSLVGPAPFIPSNTLIWLTICGLLIHGLGMAAQLVASFTDALNTAISYGFPNNLETYGLISGLWTSAFALGAFIGPSVAGMLMEGIGFRHASMFIVLLHFLVGLAAVVYLSCCDRGPKPYTEIGASEDLRVSLTDSGRSRSMGQSLREHHSRQGVPIDRPNGMNSLIACNSYSNRAGAWSRASYSGRYTHSYGSLEANRFLERTT
ncbi:MFS-type transporter SLC18B1-like [Venturia canescens]|uniref:MFS-type transporter SLC18B1-like n=1 Tax=Venturia canescens TaxID=32260 RepID=UPI001C9D386B|nr:MFS-type transporter SLC18B1-like [Venturia canescens]XP_043273087.1 MFS-type transporter SLC18B1-like [Venturia canescens]XP_043273088.1 MFS-type transporter SLC18B1-like [Venturia canescens]